jgi:predicted HAD superfamily Cof-like phosphohydrolase
MYLSREDLVSEFHKAFGHPRGVPIDEKGLSFRYKLLFEEFTELKEEFAAAMADLSINGKVSVRTKERMLKEMADLQYVLSGMAVAFDLPLQVAFVRVHKSNMSKLGEDGKPIYREDGKVLKGSRYIPVDLEDLVEEKEEGQEDVPGYEYFGAPV